MSFNYNITKRTIIDHSGKRVMAVDFLTQALGSKLPSKRKKKSCKKCKNIERLKPYSATLTDTILLCDQCRYRLISLIQRGTILAFGSIKTRPDYTYTLRLKLMRWFLNNPWPNKKNRITKTETKKLLNKLNFIITLPIDIENKQSKKDKHKISKVLQKSKYAGPWKHDFKNNCVKCNRAYHLQEHHITYNPSLTVFLCKTCHDRITALNSAAAIIARTSLTYRLTYTNKIRVILWQWFLKSKWSDKNILNILVKNILNESEFNPLKSKMETTVETVRQNTGSKADFNMSSDSNPRVFCKLNCTARQ